MKRSYATYLKRGTLVLLAAAFLVLGYLLDTRCYRLPLFEGETNFNEPDWFFGEKGTELQPTLLSDFHQVEPGKTYILTTHLSYSGREDPYPSALITTGNYETRVYLDGKLVFHYTREDRGYPRIQSIGGAAFTVSLGQDCGGRQLTLELETPMHYSSQRRLPGIVLGDYSAIMHDLLVTYLPSKAISTAIAFVVIVLLLLGNSDKDRRMGYVYFSVFAMLIVLYRAMQDLSMLYIWANPYGAVLCEFFSLAACPIPLLLSYRYVMKPHFEKVFNWTIALISVSVAVQALLHFTGTVDIVRMLTVSHLGLLAAGTVLVWSEVSARKQMLPRTRLRELVPIVVGCVMDVISFYWHDIHVGPGSFFSIGNYIGLGLLISLSMMIWEARKDREEAFLENQRTRYLERIAYRDALTGLLNRAAFTREVGEIQAGRHDDQTILVVAADLNGLKRVNDHLGHTAGDRLLQRAAAMLDTCFAPWGKVFRTGGDEFFAVLYNVGEEMWEQLEGSFHWELERANREVSLPLSIALGHAFLEPGMNIDTCIQLADRRMYRQKNSAPEHRPEPEDLEYPDG